MLCWLSIADLFVPWTWLLMSLCVFCGLYRSATSGTYPQHWMYLLMLLWRDRWLLFEWDKKASNCWCLVEPSALRLLGQPHTFYFFQTFLRFIGAVGIYRSPISANEYSATLSLLLKSFLWFFLFKILSGFPKRNQKRKQSKKSSHTIIAGWRLWGRVPVHHQRQRVTHHHHQRSPPPLQNSPNSP